MIARIRNELKTFLLATQFLTRLPVPVGNAYTKERFGESVRHYPLVGIFVGAIVAALYYAASFVWPQTVAILLSTAASLLLTGAFHEDGLADTFDGMGGGTTPQRALEIMKDSRIGTYGVVAVASVLALKVAALSFFTVTTAVITLIAAHGLSRLSSVLVISTSRYVRDDGSGKPIAIHIHARGLVYALATGALCVILMSMYLSLLTVIIGLFGAFAGHFTARRIFERKIDGYTGDCLGATQQLSEVGLYLGVLACL